MFPDKILKKQRKRNKLLKGYLFSTVFIYTYINSNYQIFVLHILLVYDITTNFNYESM